MDDIVVSDRDFYGGLAFRAACPICGEPEGILVANTLSKGKQYGFPHQFISEMMAFCGCDLQHVWDRIGRISYDTIRKELTCTDQLSWDARFVVDSTT